MKRADELRARAAEGAPQVEAARRLGISRQHVQAVARDAGIEFTRAPANLGWCRSARQGGVDGPARGCARG